MSNNKNGFEYENIVIDCLKQVEINGLISEAAGSSSWGSDADFTINNKTYNLEIKLNSGAQMGGTSIKLENGIFTICNKIDDELKKLINETMGYHLSPLKNLVDFINKEENKKLTGFPLTCKKSSWENARNEKLLINDKILFNVDFICEHYAKKNTFYIQIGQAGLFYMKNNPANLPIPKLDGEVYIEIRTGRSGSKKTSTGEEVVAAGIRVQGRLKTNCQSDYTLDNVESIKKLIQVVRENVQDPPSAKAYK
jgi:hypothetical protein